MVLLHPVDSRFQLANLELLGSNAKLPRIHLFSGSSSVELKTKNFYFKKFGEL